MTYRDDHQAALDRVASAEAELADLQQERDVDKARISSLQADLEAAQSSLTALRSGSLPSNASSVILLGVLGLMMCQILGPFAWILANRELDQIARGNADPSMRRTVVAGKVLGIIATVVMVLVALSMLLSFAG